MDKKQTSLSDNFLQSLYFPPIPLYSRGRDQVPFHLVLLPPKDKDTPVEDVMNQYIEENRPVITKEADGRISVGIVFFDDMSTRISSVRKVEQLADMIKKLHKKHPDYAVCVLFEQSTGTPLLVVVKTAEVDELISLLNSGFDFYATSELG